MKKARLILLMIGCAVCAGRVPAGDAAPAATMALRIFATSKGSVRPSRLRTCAGNAPRSGCDAGNRVLMLMHYL